MVEGLLSAHGFWAGSNFRVDNPGMAWRGRNAEFNVVVWS